MWAARVSAGASAGLRRCSSEAPGLRLLRAVRLPLEPDTGVFLHGAERVRVLPAPAPAPASHLELRLYGAGAGAGAAGELAVRHSAARLELRAEGGELCVLLLPPGAHLAVAARGAIEARRLHAGRLALSSACGAVVCEGRLQARAVRLQAGGDGGIFCDNVLSERFVATTHAGNIDVSACYSERSHFTTARGDINLNHLHRDCIVDVIERGSLHVSGLEGRLRASIKSGDVFVHASKLTDRSSIFVHENGRVEMRISEAIEASTTINLIADKIDVDEEIKKSGRYMDDSHPQRFRYPLPERKETEESNPFLHVECRNGIIELKHTAFPFMIRT